MRYVSVCSGIEAATVAWHPLGWTAAAFSEIEAFPSSVLAHHYPGVPNLGDMEAHASWRVSNVDLLVGGTPCQSFSVAGLRKGMADPRGNLALVYLAIADQLRPEWVVWENVPGVLSSNGGRDFGAFLGALGQLGYGWAYRVLDAQYFGVPQRRRRVFVVGCARGWQRAAAVLFERASLRGDSAPGRETGEGVALPLTSRVDRGGEHREDHGNNLIAHSLSAEGCDASEDGTGRGTPLVAAPLTTKPYADNEAQESRLVADPIQANEARTYCNSGNNPRPHSLVAAPLTAGGAPNSNAPGRRKEDDVNLVACFDETQITHPENRSAASAALARGARPPAVAFDEYNTSESEQMHTLAGMDFANRRGAVRKESRIRRLTPRECERLQGFPDDYTLIPWRSRRTLEAADLLYLRLTQPELSMEAARRLAQDTPRYRALGNSMAVPVMRWIGERISAVCKIEPQEDRVA